MLMDRRPSVYSHVTEQKHVKRSYDGTVVNESDVLLCERRRLSLDPAKLETWLRTAGEPRAGEHGLQWSVGSRLIGFEKDKNGIGETQPCTCWVICNSVPVCVAIDRLLPCTPTELLAFHYTQTKSCTPLAADTQTPQGFIDERTSLDILTAADSSRIVEDEQDDETSESTQITSAENRKKTHKDESAKVLRALLPITASSHASSLRLDDETQEQLARSPKQARTTRTGVETLPDVSFLFSKGTL